MLYRQDLKARQENYFQIGVCANSDLAKYGFGTNGLLDSIGDEESDSTGVDGNDNELGSGTEQGRKVWTKEEFAEWNRLVEEQGGGISDTSFDWILTFFGGKLLKIGGQSLKPIANKLRPASKAGGAIEKLKPAARITGGTANQFKGSQLRNHYRQLEKYGSGGFKELQSGRIRYYGDITKASKSGEMAGRRVVREWNPASGNNARGQTI